MENPRSASERVLTWLETTLRERNNPEGAFQKGSRHLKRALTVATFGYFVAFLGFLFCWIDGANEIGFSAFYFLCRRSFGFRP